MEEGSFSFDEQIASEAIDAEIFERNIGEGDGSWWFLSLRVYKRQKRIFSFLSPNEKSAFVPLYLSDGIKSCDDEEWWGSFLVTEDTKFTSVDPIPSVITLYKYLAQSLAPTECHSLTVYRYESFSDTKIPSSPLCNASIGFPSFVQKSSVRGAVYLSVLDIWYFFTFFEKACTPTPDFSFPELFGWIITQECLS